MAPAGCFLRGLLPRLRPPRHPWPRRAVSCAASCRGYARRAIHGPGGPFFAQPPAAVMPAAPSMAPAGCFLRGLLPGTAGLAHRWRRVAEGPEPDGLQAVVRRPGSRGHRRRRPLAALSVDREESLPGCHQPPSVPKCRFISDRGCGVEAGHKGAGARGPPVAIDLRADVSLTVLPFVQRMLPSLRMQAASGARRLRGARHAPRGNVSGACGTITATGSSDA